jgi:hypothetical protein
MPNKPRPERDWNHRITVNVSWSPASSDCPSTDVSEGPCANSTASAETQTNRRRSRHFDANEEVRRESAAWCVMWIWPATAHAKRIKERVPVATERNGSCIRRRRRR